MPEPILPAGLDPTVLHQLYVTQQCSIRQVAAAIGSNYTSVRTALYRMRILRIRGSQLNPRRPPDTELRRRYATGETQAQLAQAYGVGAATISRWLHTPLPQTTQPTTASTPTGAPSPGPRR
jgi:hypothetical protein